MTAIHFTREDLPEDELREEFLCAAAGPGGQHVNRTATAVRLIFHVMNSRILDESAKARLCRIAHAPDGVIVILAKDTRSFALNRELARERLAALIEKALAVPKKRRKTKPTKASQERRLRAKSIRSRIKSARSGVRED